MSANKLCGLHQLSEDVEKVPGISGITMFWHMSRILEKGEVPSGRRSTIVPINEGNCHWPEHACRSMNFMVRKNN